MSTLPPTGIQHSWVNLSHLGGDPIPTRKYLLLARMGKAVQVVKLRIRKHMLQGGADGLGQPLKEMLALSATPVVQTKTAVLCSQSIQGQ